MCLTNNKPGMSANYEENELIRNWWTQFSDFSHTHIILNFSLPVWDEALLAVGWSARSWKYNNQPGLGRITSNQVLEGQRPARSWKDNGQPGLGRTTVSQVLEGQQCQVLAGQRPARSWRDSGRPGLGGTTQTACQDAEEQELGLVGATACSRWPWSEVV